MTTFRFIVAMMCFAIPLGTASAQFEYATAPSSVQPLRIEGAWLMVLPGNEPVSSADYEQVANTLRKLLSQLEKVPTNSAMAERIALVNQSLANHSLEVAKKWFQFKLVLDGKKRHYELFDIASGKLVRNVAFDGQKEVQHFVDSHQANVFGGRSNVFIPSLSTFFPITDKVAGSSEWKKVADDQLVLQSAEIATVGYRATLDEINLLREFVTMNNERSLKSVFTSGWQNLHPGFKQPSSIATLKPSGSSGVQSIHIYLINSVSSTELSAGEFVVAAPEGTNVFRGGLGTPTLTGTKLLSDSSNVAEAIGLPVKELPGS